jgi:hypothetical protein
LYLTGEFSKDILNEHKKRLESSIAGLEQEKARLMAELRISLLSQEQTDYLTKVAKGFKAAEDSFPTRRAVIEALNVRASLKVENGEKVIYVSRVISDEKRLSIDIFTTLHKGDIIKALLKPICRG